MMRLAVIGDPIGHSKSPEVYSHIFSSLGIQLQFVRHRVCISELSSFMHRKKALDAFLVTMPLKQKILDYLSFVNNSALSCQACNFVIIKNGQYHGFNTDGLGALGAIERHICVAGRRMLILGAGGCASAICYEAKKRGAKVYIYNKTKQKGLRLATKMGVRSVDSLRATYDIIVQATSVGLVDQGFSFTLSNSIFNSCQLALEVNYAKNDTPFIKRARGFVKNLVRGEEMYYFMMKEQCRLLLNLEICDLVFFEKIVEIIRELNSQQC